MSPDPFIFVSNEGNIASSVQVTSGHEAFKIHDQDRTPLPRGEVPLGSDPVLLVDTQNSFNIHEISLGSAILHGKDGRWQPLRVCGNLTYCITKPDSFADHLEQEGLRETQQFEKELTRLIVDHLSSFVDGEAWGHNPLDVSLQTASGELVPHLESLLAPLGLGVQRFDLETQ